jgi:hypothetical protein
MVANIKNPALRLMGFDGGVKNIETKMGRTYDNVHWNQYAIAMAKVMPNA